MSLPASPLRLINSNQTEDVASLSIVHNKNMSAIAAYVNQVVDYLSTLNTNVSISQSAFNTLLTAAKNFIVLRVDMVDNDVIDFNGFRLTRIGIPLSYASPTIEFRITDTNNTRNTDFKNVLIAIKSMSGQYVYPIITNTTSYISIIFSDALSVTATTVNPDTDPNNKYIILL